MKRVGKILFPVLVVALAVAAAVFAFVARPQAKSEIRRTPVPLIRVVMAHPQNVEMIVHTQGAVTPRTEIDLVAEVAGRVVEASDLLSAGSFFDKGDVLVRIDPRDYQLAVESARAEVAHAEVEVAQEKAESELAKRDWLRLHGAEKAPSLVIRAPQLAEAKANFAGAKASLDRAALDLERSVVRAPFDGRVRAEHVGLGEFVSRGTVLARVYAIDRFEIRLPVRDEELAYLDLSTRPAVRLSLRFAGSLRHWSGRIVRTEGELDPKSRMVTLVAEVLDPYHRDGSRKGTALDVGMFVNAEIVGREEHDVYVLPRAAMRSHDRVLVVDDGDALRYRPVTVLRRQAEQVIVNGGLSPAQKICVSPLDTVTDGMPVRVYSPEKTSERETAEPAS